MCFQHLQDFLRLKICMQLWKLNIALFSFDFRVSIVYRVLWLQSERYPPSKLNKQKGLQAKAKIFLGMKKKKRKGKNTRKDLEQDLDHRSSIIHRLSPDLDHIQKQSTHFPLPIELSGIQGGFGNQTYSFKFSVG